MKNFRFFVLFFLSLGVFFSCSFTNAEKKYSELSITLPKNQNKRAIQYNDDDGSMKFEKAGTLSIDYIDEYEITLTSSSGQIYSDTVNAEQKKITFSEIEVGEWNIELEAFAIGKDNQKILVARNSEPVTTTVKANETTEVTIPAKLVKYSLNIENNIFISGDNTAKIINQDENLSLLNSLYTFEYESEIIKLNEDYTITPLKPGEATINYTRIIDNYQGTITVTVSPLVTVNFIVDGEFYASTIIDENSTQAIDYFVIDDDIYNNIKQGLFSWWFYDSEYSEGIYNIEGYENIFNLSEKYNELNGDEQLTTTINIYSKCKAITDSEDLTTALITGGEYTINGGEFIIYCECRVNFPTTITFNDEVYIKRDEYCTGTMINICQDEYGDPNGGSLTIKPNSNSLDKYFHFDGSLPTGGTVESKIMEIGRETEGNSSFTNVVFENNNYGSDWSHPSAILIAGTGLNQFFNCKVQNNSISGLESRAPGVKIEENTNVTIDGIEFSNNACSSYPYGLDIWVESSNSNIILKGTIINTNDISLHYKNTDETNIPINVQNIDISNSSNFKVTYGTEDLECNLPSTDIQIFDFGDNGDILKDKFELYNNTEIVDTHEFDSDGKVVEKQEGTNVDPLDID